MVASSPDAVNTVVTIFSILAGFLIAVITFVADPAIKQARNWDELQLMKDTVERKLFRYKILFFLYLVTLGVALLMSLSAEDMVELKVWLQTIFLGLTVFVFLASFSLPGSLMKIQMEKYDAELKKNQPKVIAEAKRKLKERG